MQALTDMDKELLVADLPTIDLSNCNAQDLEKFAKLGMCYINTSNEHELNTALIDVRTKALTFFHEPPEVKNKKLFSESTDRSGYMNHTTDTQAGYSEQCVFDPRKPIAYFSELNASFSVVGSYFTQSIGYVLINKMMEHLKISDCESELKKLSADNNFMFNAIYYPSSVNTNSKFGLKPHKDFYPFISILSPGEEPGLQIFIDHQWYAVSYRANHLLAIIGQPLELILGERCTAPVHRVCVPLKERLTCGVSIDPSADAPIVDLTTGALKFETYKSFLEQKVSPFYIQNAEESNQPPPDSAITGELSRMITNFTHKFGSPIHQSLSDGRLDQLHLRNEEKREQTERKSFEF